MEAIIRAVRKSPNVFREQLTKGKHTKLPEGWGDNKDYVKGGMTFYLKYLGSTLLDELQEGESYGEGIAAKRVHNVVAQAKLAGKKLTKVSLTVNPKGIKAIDLMNKESMLEVSIYRISFCTADKDHERVFAFIERNTINETMQLHAYMCAKKKIAQAVALTVSQAFNVAHADEVKTEKEKENLRRERLESSHDTKSRAAKASIAPSSDKISFELNESIATSPSRSATKRGWQEFDEDVEDSDDPFSRLAENRIGCLSSFSTDLRQEDFDDSIELYLNESKCFEEFSRQKSIEDLLNL